MVMSRVSEAVLHLARRNQQHRGVPVVYVRREWQSGETRLPITAIPARESTQATKPTNGRGARVEHLEREFILVVPDLVMDGILFVPEKGDTILEVVDGSEVAFRLVDRPDRKCWRYEDATRQMIRVYCEQVR
jgi:hypothetical protein